MKTARKHAFIKDWKTAGRGCFWCGGSFGRRARGATIDHFFPRSRGGSCSGRNAVVAHRTCNNQRGNSIPSEADIRRFVSVCGKEGIQNLREFGERLSRALPAPETSSTEASLVVTPTAGASK